MVYTYSMSSVHDTSYASSRALSQNDWDCRDPGHRSSLRSFIYAFASSIIYLGLTPLLYSSFTVLHTLPLSLGYVTTCTLRLPPAPADSNSLILVSPPMILRVKFHQACHDHTPEYFWHCRDIVIFIFTLSFDLAFAVLRNKV